MYPPKPVKPDAKPVKPDAKPDVSNTSVGSSSSEPIDLTLDDDDVRVAARKNPSSSSWASSSDGDSGPAEDVVSVTLRKWRTFWPSRGILIRLVYIVADKAEVLSRLSGGITISCFRDHTRHFSNWCDIDKVAKVVQRKRSDSCCNRSTIWLSIPLLELYGQTPCSLSHLEHTHAHTTCAHIHMPHPSSHCACVFLGIFEDQSNKIIYKKKSASM